jgi:CIC family chloride channel protein
VLGSAVIASGAAWVVLHSLLGNEPLFHVPEYQLVHPAELLVYAVLGVAGGFCSVAFVRLTLALRARFLALPVKTRWMQPAVGGLTVGLLALWTPQVLGVGYDYVGQVLNGEITLTFVVSLLVLKLFAIAVCYASGNSGGIFGPSLFLGAMLGASVGTIAHLLLPALTANPGAYALVGMGAVFAGIIRVPLTSVFMIFELTRDYAIVVPLMIANMASFAISRRFQRIPIYEALALQDGIQLPRPARERAGSGAMVSGVIQRDVPVLPPTAAIADVPSTVAGCVVVVDDGKAAAFTRSELQEVALYRGSDAPLSALIQDGIAWPHVHPDHSLEEALELLEENEGTAIAVLDRADLRRVLGLVTLADVRAAFRQ